MKYGTDHPNQIDLLGTSEGVCFLAIIQAEPLDPESTLRLQDKINHYLTYILDGQMLEENPSLASLPKVIQLHLQHEPTGIATEFLERVSSVLAQEGVGFEVEISSGDA